MKIQTIIGYILYIRGKQLFLNVIITLVMEMNNVDIDTQKIGRRLAQFRKEKKLTQEALSEIINMSANHISTIENGGSYSLNALITICDCLGVTLDHVIYGNLRNNKIDNFIDLLNLCNDYEISVLFSVAESLLSNREK